MLAKTATLSTESDRTSSQLPAEARFPATSAPQSHNPPKRLQLLPTRKPIEVKPLRK
ncbi:hypothetical protein [Microcoleus sp. FACHB-68]|uniref:hypothetical protein n=1 Tax=Microcoleus sp. FACHB-68 TaxID=2692826 RepID=UPI001686984A|nr:hypothetical protein [Microcoleus sp. FACHB-68]